MKLLMSEYLITRVLNPTIPGEGNTLIKIGVEEEGAGRRYQVTLPLELTLSMGHRIDFVNATPRRWCSEDVQKHPGTEGNLTSKDYESVTLYGLDEKPLIKISSEDIRLLEKNRERKK